jgi:DNA-binding PadR family transcriptional regulator
VLGFLAERPMHAYAIQQLIKTRGKDTIANVAQPNSVYQTIDRLRREALVAVHDTVRAERRPERTVYDITAAGRETLRHWLRTVLSSPGREFPDFPAALAFLPLLEPEEVVQQLEERVVVLEARLADAPPAPPGLPRLFLIEDEYQQSMTRAELDWLRALLDDLRSGRLTWNEALLQQYETELEPQHAGDATRYSGFLTARPSSPRTRNPKAKK